MVIHHVDGFLLEFIFFSILSSSCSQLDNSMWNVDLQELDYNPSKKDLTDARIHHLLTAELCQPPKKVGI